MDKFGFGKKKDKKIEGLEEVQKKISDAEKKARECLKSPLFQDLLEEYQGAEAKMIDFLLNYSKKELDPVIFGLVSRETVSSVRHVRTLIEGITKKVGKDA